MIHFVDFKLTRTYSGRIPIDARDMKEAERNVNLMAPSDLQSLASNSFHTVVSKSEPPLDPRQLKLFEEDDDGN